MGSGGPQKVGSGGWPTLSCPSIHFRPVQTSRYRMPMTRHRTGSHPGIPAFGTWDGIPRCPGRELGQISRDEHPGIPRISCPTLEVCTERPLLSKAYPVISRHVGTWDRNSQAPERDPIPKSPGTKSPIASNSSHFLMGERISVRGRCTGVSSGSAWLCALCARTAAIRHWRTCYMMRALHLRTRRRPS